MLEHAIGAFERREDDAGEPLELRARARQALWRGQAGYPMWEVAIDEHDVTRAIRDVESAANSLPPPPIGFHSPLTSWLVSGPAIAHGGMAGMRGAACEVRQCRWK